MGELRKVLFLCTGNACRSQMAEAILCHLGDEKFEAVSAGSHPAGFVHELAIEAMRSLNIPMDEARHVSKSWDEFADDPVAVVITVCDAAAGETCPVWPGGPLRAHWPLPDPVFHFGSDEARLNLALSVAQRLVTKIQGLVDMDWSLDREEIATRLKFLGEI